MNDREYYDRLASAYLRGRAERMSQEGPEIRAEGEKQEEKLYYFKRSPEKLPRVRMALGFLRSVWPESLLDVGSGRRSQSCWQMSLAACTARKALPRPTRRGLI